MALLTEQNTRDVVKTKEIQGVLGLGMIWTDCEKWKFRSDIQDAFFCGTARLIKA